MGGDELGLVLAEQQAAVMLLLNRATALAAVDPGSAQAAFADHDPAVKAIFAHVQVVEAVDHQSPGEAAHSATLKVALELVGKHLVAALEEQASSNGSALYALLGSSLPVLFAAEARAFSAAGQLADTDLGANAAELFATLTGSLDRDEIWAHLVKRYATDC